MMKSTRLALFVFLYLSAFAIGKQFPRRQASPTPQVSLPTPGTQGTGATAVAANNGGTTPPPAGKAPAGDINLTVLNFALTLENLEAQFYQDALAIFTPQVMQQAGLSAFQATAITQQIQRQLVDEQTHVQILQAAIQSAGGVPFAGCQFNFRSVLTDPITFLSSARSIEAAGVSAYIGGASLITNAGVLGAAVTILPIESRHSSILNLFAGGSATPQSFDIPLTPPQVLAVVGGLLQNCQASDLGLTANQPLSVIDGVTQSTLFSAGSILQFQTSAQIQNLQTNTLSCQMLIGGSTTALVMSASSCIIPAQVSGGPLNGPVMVFLTSNATPLTTNLAAQAQNVVAGPAIIFVDSNQQDVFGQIFTVRSLNIRTLPTANIASAALSTQPGTRRANGAPAGQGARGGAQNNTGAGAKNARPTRKSRSLFQSNSTAETFTGMNNLGMNPALMDVGWGAVPQSVVQSPSQVNEKHDVGALDSRDTTSSEFQHETRTIRADRERF
ncbi:hypothetical protein CROQUDRAFT_668884 [Cronartium quercuum f. sp. fusiforme G11]|uniref:Uncharacterized protein n=1 Tax=Cronartium quercuum f. sp. fusiforme G11 TaxID=708437 RepID=A0A9P6NTC4_9BASI|nr:hypothetical protein CROQUDRAFT_668884 [Cronartium quercuum f. sp. fusiforme G11]